MPTDSMYDQENIDARQRSNKSKDASRKTPGSTKRPLESVNSGEEPSSQRTKTTTFQPQRVKNAKKTAKATSKKTDKKKSAPLLKGQKQLTAFFRL